MKMKIEPFIAPSALIDTLMKWKFPHLVSSSDTNYIGEIYDNALNQQGIAANRLCLLGKSAQE